MGIGIESLSLVPAQARLDDLREAAANAAAEREEEEGEEGAEEPEITLGDEPIIDVESEVAAAVEKVGVWWYGVGVNVTAWV
jgi:hypothetical protein